MSQNRSILDEVRELRDAVESRVNTGLGGNHVNTVRIDAGGAGVWICVTASIVSMAMCAFMAVMFLDMNRKYDRTQDLLSVIYQQAPWLKPPAETPKPEKKD